MTKAYKKPTTNEIDLNQLRKTSGLKKSTLVRKHLQLVPQKHIASDLKVSTQSINNWAHGTPIPFERVEEILRSLKGYYRSVRQHEDELDLALWNMGE